MSRPLIAILRGITPAEAVPVAHALVGVGIDRIEVPLNSPEAINSISAIVESVAREAQVGAGTVITSDEVMQVHRAGGQFIVSPNTDVDVIRATKAVRMQSIPGVLTPSECFAAIAAGADALKFFPASLLGADGLKAIHAVLPQGTPKFVVGGVDAANLRQWMLAGADGFGLGTSIYTPGSSLSDTVIKAGEIVAAYDSACVDNES